MISFERAYHHNKRPSESNNSAFRSIPESATGDTSGVKGEQTILFKRTVENSAANNNEIMSRPISMDRMSGRVAD